MTRNERDQHAILRGSLGGQLNTTRFSLAYPNLNHLWTEAQASTQASCHLQHCTTGSQHQCTQRCMCVYVGGSVCIYSPVGAFIQWMLLGTVTGAMFTEGCGRSCKVGRQDAMQHRDLFRGSSRSFLFPQQKEGRSCTRVHNWQTPTITQH